MSRYVHIFLGPPDVSKEQVLADVEAATELKLEWVPDPGFFEGLDGARMVRVFTRGNIYVDEPHLPFSAHPFQITFYTAEKTIESERRFLDEVYRRLRETGRYSLFASQGVQTRIDPD